MTDNERSMMSRLLTLFVTLATPLWLAMPLLGLAGEPPVVQPSEGRGPEDQPVRKYTKVWTDDYGNYKKEVYRAYTKTLKDEQGDEVSVEIWHGKATGFHKNGNKSWEVEYRNGKREGEFASWSDSGVQTGLATFQRGLLQGKSFEWSRDGRKKSEQSYEKGKLNAEARWWDADGELLAVGTYRGGNPWTGAFLEWVTPPDDSSYAVICQYEGGKKVSAKKLRAD